MSDHSSTTAWLTVEDVSKRLGFHADTVRRLLREGRLKGYRLNRRAGWRIRPEDVDRFITGEPDADRPPVTPADAGEDDRR